MSASNGRFGGKMATTILFLFLVPCVLCLRINSPSISRVSPPVLAEEGADAEMDCQVQHATEYPGELHNSNFKRNESKIFLAFQSSG